MSNVIMDYTVTPLWKDHRRVILFTLIIVLGLISRIPMIFQEPAHYEVKGVYQELFPDELAHWQYIHYVHVNHALPDSSEPFWYSAKMKSDFSYENYQQPLYYVAMSFLAFDNPKVARAWSIVFWLVSMILLWKATNNLIFIAFFSLLPAQVVCLTLISNDTLLFLGACLTVYAMKRHHESIYFCGLTILALSKVQGVAVVIALLVFELLIKKDRQSYALYFLISLFGMIVFISRYYLAANQSVYWQFNTDSLAHWFFVMLSTTFATLISSPTIPQINFVPFFGTDEVSGMFRITSTFIFAAPLAYFMIKWLLKTLKRNSKTNYAFAFYSVLLVYLFFALSHSHWIGRLLYSGIPFLMALSTEKNEVRNV